MESYERGGSDQDASRHLSRPLGQLQDLGYVLHRQFITAEYCSRQLNIAALLSPEVCGGVKK